MSSPNLNGLRVFESVGRLGQIAAAADELNVTPGAVSQQLRTLQDSLGLRLFEKRGRGIVLNDYGTALHQTVGHTLSLLTRQIRELRSADESLEEAAPIELVIPPFFGLAWATPVLFEFMRNTPRIRLNVTSAVQFKTIDWKRTDIAINMGSPPWPGFWSCLLHRVKLIPVCSPQLLRGRHPIRSTSDLAHHRLLHEDGGAEWRRWLALAGMPAPDTPDILFDNFAMIMEAARDGQGVALIDELLASKDLDSGRLVQPVPLSISGSCHYHIICREQSLAQRHIQKLIHWLTTAASKPILENANAGEEMQRGAGA